MDYSLLLVVERVPLEEKTDIDKCDNNSIQSDSLLID